MDGIAKCHEHQHTKSIRLSRRMASQPAFARQPEPGAAMEFSKMSAAVQDK
ncbi:hypothetical protein [Mesorhizobium captivum]|uniref:hypothetical protein n=1 Tax=Mesorhizobium captivum TaxID=3072319 RepID=UPI002A23D792|nr:hypothetical protein [Mesorhizobium sp. VK3C]MDX8448097.1 hypothetical protein [Mesorhizobium sp. VK3C]